MDAVRPFAITALLVAAWVLTPLGGFPMAFVKLDGVMLPYAVVFFTILLGCLFLLRRKIGQANWIGLLLVAVVGGHLASIFSITVAELIAPTGMERLANSLRAAGLLRFFGVQLVYPAVLLGWFIAPLAASALKVSKRFI